ncbi:MAG: hypothetical protein B6I26_07310 [Desulfobacteraceae bacterium 4572_130]|nr:MAG: hypothetical protein B6I26_07310 [Desulfobacteraceae bacterium 4572_130]
MAVKNDIILIYRKDSPMCFARIENIKPDAKKDWYHVKILMLQIPLQVVTWILKDIYINGEEFFMDNKKMQIKIIQCPKDKNIDFDNLSIDKTKEKNLKKKSKKEEKQKNAEIISFADIKKTKQKKQ